MSGVTRTEKIRTVFFGERRADLFCFLEEIYFLL